MGIFDRHHMRRALLPRGQQLLLGEQPPPESGFWPLYLMFDAALLTCSSLAIGSLVRLLRGGIRRRDEAPESIDSLALHCSGS